MKNEAKETNLNDTGLSSIYALDCLMFIEIAKILKKNQAKEILLNRYNTVKEAINEKMWHEINGIYCNMTLDNKFSKVYSPTSFYLMMQE